MSSKKGKKLILIRNDILEEAAKITSREGKTVYAFTNEIFEQALKAYEMQTSPAELVEFFTLMKLEKDSGTTIIPVDLLDYMLTKMYNTDKEELLKKWYEAGHWWGKYLSIKSQPDDWVQTFEKLVKKCAWNITDFSVNHQQGHTNVKCVAPHFALESTEALTKFFEGVMHSAGYKTVKNECLKGIILLTLKKPD